MNPSPEDLAKAIVGADLATEVEKAFQNTLRPWAHHRGRCLDLHDTRAANEITDTELRRLIDIEEMDSYDRSTTKARLLARVRPWEGRWRWTIVSRYDIDWFSDRRVVSFGFEDTAELAMEVCDQQLEQCGWNLA